MLPLSKNDMPSNRQIPLRSKFINYYFCARRIALQYRTVARAILDNSQRNNNNKLIMTCSSIHAHITSQYSDVGDSIHYTILPVSRLFPLNLSPCCQRHGFELHWICVCVCVRKSMFFIFQERSGYCNNRQLNTTNIWCVTTCATTKWHATTR